MVESPRVSSSGRPGPCITPSRVTLWKTLIFVMFFSVSKEPPHRSIVRSLRSYFKGPALPQCNEEGPVRLR